MIDRAQGHYQKQAAPPSAPSPLPVSQDRLEAWHLWQVGILVLACSENKNKRCLFFEGRESVKENCTNVLRGAFLEKRGSPVPCDGSVLRGHTLGLSSGSGLHVQQRGNCISVISTVKGWLLSREVQSRPGYMASGPGGSLKSLAADTSLLMCLSSVMPAC